MAVGTVVVAAVAAAGGGDASALAPQQCFSNRAVISALVIHVTVLTPLALSAAFISFNDGIVPGVRRTTRVFFFFRIESPRPEGRHRSLNDLENGRPPHSTRKMARLGAVVAPCALPARSSARVLPTRPSPTLAPVGVSRARETNALGRAAALSPRLLHGALHAPTRRLCRREISPPQCGMTTRRMPTRIDFKSHQYVFGEYVDGRGPCVRRA